MTTPTFRDAQQAFKEAIAAGRLSAETLKEITDALEQCITDEGATARKSHARAMQRLHYISEVARAALAKVRT